MKSINGFIKMLMTMVIITITVVIVFFGYIIITEKENEEKLDIGLNITNNIIDNHVEEEEREEDKIITANNLFYVQLDENAKVIYKALDKNKEAMKNGDYILDFGYQFNEDLQKENGMEELNKSFQSAWNAYRFDNMDIFYLDVKNLILYTKKITTNKKTSYEVFLGPAEGKKYLAEGFENKEDVEKAEKEIETIKNEVVMYARGTNEDKIKKMHNWIVNNVNYEKVPNDKMAYDVYGAFYNKKAVCEGYARAFKMLMDELNIPCIMVAGTASNSAGERESHAWNYVFLEGTWYAVDTTWDDPIIIGNGILEDERKYKYYLKGSKTFFETHKQNGLLSENSMEFLYPELSIEDYVRTK